VNPDSPRLRLSILGIVVVSLFASLFARLWYLQVMAGPEYKVAAEVNRVRVVAVEAPRGRILDRNGKVLVDNRISVVVTVDRSALRELSKKEHARVLGRLSEELTRAGQPLTVPDLEARIADERFSPYTPVPVAQDLPEELKIYLEEHAAEFPSVAVERLSVRSYPYGKLAAHVVGYVGEINDTEIKAQEGKKKAYQLGDEIGKSGVEKIYEDDLRGKPGVRKIEVDADGNPVRLIDDGSSVPVPGDDVVLSLDINVQAVAEQALVEGLDAAKGRRVRAGNPPNKAPAGSVVVLDPTNGTVVAMASYPNFAPAEFVNGISSSRWAELNDPASRYPLNNWAIQGQYAPGSTFKLFSGYAAMTSGVRAPGDTYLDKGVYTVPNCRGASCTFRNAGSQAHGRVDMRKAITLSSDVFFYDIGAQFWIQRDRLGGEEAMQEKIRRFGLGTETGIPLPSEQDGRIPDPAQRRRFCEEVACVEGAEKWRTGDSVNMAIGQGEVAVTPLQLANGYATFANGGKRYSPNIATAVRTGGTDRVLRTIDPRLTATIDMPPDVRQALLDGLIGVTTADKGTATSVFRGFPNDTWPVAAKTGTAQVSKKADTAVFAAFGPATDPKYVITVFLEESGFGGVAAAPVARRLFDVLSGAVVMPEAPPDGLFVPGDASIASVPTGGED
jgi:penicillin-binding protein 2